MCSTAIAFCAPGNGSRSKNEFDLLFLHLRRCRVRTVGRNTRKGGERFATSNLQCLCWSCRSRKSAQEGLRGLGKEKRGTITSPRCLCVTEPKPLILRKRFHPTPTSRKRKIILVEYKKEKFRLISALQALRVRRCVCFRR